MRAAPSRAGQGAVIRKVGIAAVKALKRPLLSKRARNGDCPNQAPSFGTTPPPI